MRVSSVCVWCAYGCVVFVWVSVVFVSGCVCDVCGFGMECGVFVGFVDIIYVPVFPTCPSFAGNR